MDRACAWTLCLILSGAACLGQGWPQFRGPGARGIADGQNLPVSWDAESERNILWKREISGLAHSSPIVWGDRIYLTSAQADLTPELKLGDVDRSGIDPAKDMVEHRWLLYAFDTGSGELVWQKTAHQGVPRMKRHVKASHSSQTPVTDGKRILALFGSEGLFCFDMQGNLLWKKDLGILDAGLWGEPEYQWGAASSPILYQNLVIVQNDRQKDSFLAAYRLEDGQEAWKASRDEKPAWSTPVIYQGGGKAELITNSANYMRGYDPLTGKELWRLSNDNEVITPTPVVGDGIVVMTGGYPPAGKPIYAIRPAGGKDLSQQASQPSNPHLLWKAERGSPYTATPIIYKGILYACRDNGILSAYDLKSGRQIYRDRLAAGAGFSASAVASDDKIYFPSEDGDIYVLKAGSEFELLATNPMGEALMATPAISNGKLFVRGRSHLFAIGR